jgi:putative flippase GtrA
MTSDMTLSGRLRDLAARPGARQFLIFAAVGAAATVVQYSVLVLLVEFARVQPVPAAVLAYMCGALVSYLLNSRFTFGETKTAFGKGLVKFLLVNVIGLGLNTAIFTALVHLHVHYLLAQMVATGLVLVWNYAGARLFVFRG